MVLGKWDRYMQKNKTRPPSYATHKNEFKWIKDLNVTHETIKILEEKIGSKLSDVAYSNILSDVLFSYYVGCLIILLMFSFAVQKHFTLM